MSVSRGCKWDISYSFALGYLDLGQIIECEAILKREMVGKFGGMIPPLAAKLDVS